MENVSNLIKAGHIPKTVNGHEGAIQDLPNIDEYMFVYGVDKKLILVYVTDEALLEDIII